MKRKLFVSLAVIVIITTIVSLSACAPTVSAQELGIKIDTAKQIIRIEALAIGQYNGPDQHDTRVIECTDEGFSKATDIMQNLVDSVQLKKKNRIVANKSFQINVIYNDDTMLSLVGLSDGKLNEEIIWLTIDGEWYESNLLRSIYLDPIYDYLHDETQKV